jgi:hypothetical protein
MDDNQPTMTVDEDGDTVWRLNGKYHRTDGPAIIFANQGYKAWWVHDARHRTDGPAMEWGSGRKEWFLHGIRLSFDEWLDQNQTLTDEEKVMYKLEHG